MQQDSSGINSLSMNDIAIRVENLGKKYKIGGVKQGSFRESFTHFFFKNGKATPSQSGSTIGMNGTPLDTSGDFWALKDINFEIKRGEAVGIIGRNGAGKSTLLKILSRITKPTTGRYEVFGRVSSLLEVGTGFHEELTGRENVYLNGTILGMKRKEVKAKFDEIIAFSGVEKFIDTPVKHYSSGMKVRLAFSVAAFLEPEILIIDEVLAVGDSVFQAKCIERMTEVTREGRTVLFVSHNMSAVKKLCTKGMLITEGKLSMSGNIDNIIDQYAFFSSKSGKVIDLSHTPRKKYGEELIFEQVSFKNNPIEFGDEIDISVKLKNISESKKVIHKDLDFGIAIKDKNLNTAIHVSNRFIHYYIDHENDNDEYLFKIENNLKPGIYYLTLFLRSNDEIQDWLSDVIRLEISDGNPYDFNDTKQITGIIMPRFSLNVQQTTIA